MLKKTASITLLGSILLAAQILFGQSVGSEKKDDASQLKKRADIYWQARALRDWHTMYRMEGAARPGGWMTPSKNQYEIGLPVRKPRIIAAEVAGDKGTVTVEAEVSVGTLGWMKQSVKDGWVRIAGEWYHHISAPNTTPIPSNLVSGEKE